MPRVWLVSWKGEHEDWPIAIFRDEERAVAFAVNEHSTTAIGNYWLVQEVEFEEAVRVWKALND